MLWITGPVPSLSTTQHSWTPSDTNGAMVANKKSRRVDGSLLFFGIIPYSRNSLNPRRKSVTVGADDAEIDSHTQGLGLTGFIVSPTSITALSHQIIHDFFQDSGLQSYVNFILRGSSLWILAYVESSIYGLPPMWTPGHQPLWIQAYVDFSLSTSAYVDSSLTPVFCGVRPEWTAASVDLSLCRLLPACPCLPSSLCGLYPAWTPAYLDFSLCGHKPMLIPVYADSILLWL